MKTLIAPFALLLILMAPATAMSTQARNNVVEVQAPHDAWQVRSLETQKIIEVIRDPKATEAQHTKARDGFDARLTAAEKGELTPIETMELLGLFYVPKELQNKPPNIAPLLRIIATQATLGWYDALRFADDSGRAEIANNEAFFTLPLQDNAAVVIEFMQNHTEQAAAAVKNGIQDARDKIGSNKIGYDQHWPASYGLLRMQCGMNHAKICEKPKPREASQWPELLDEAAEKVGSFYRAPNNTK